MKERTNQILTAAEKKLRQLLAEGAPSADIADITQLADVTRQLHLLITQLDDSDGATPSATIASEGPRCRRTTRSPGRRTEYPQFEWDDGGDTLVKIGWSKKKRQEYHHRAPKKVLHFVKDKLDKLGAGHNLVTMEDVLPITDPNDGQEIPAYQVYLCIKYLQQNGLIRRSKDGLQLTGTDSHTNRAKTAGQC